MALLTAENRYFVNVFRLKKKLSGFANDAKASTTKEKKENVERSYRKT